MSNNIDKTLELKQVIDRIYGRGYISSIINIRENYSQGQNLYSLNYGHLEVNLDLNQLNRSITSAIENFLSAILSTYPIGEIEREITKERKLKEEERIKEKNTRQYKKWIDPDEERKRRIEELEMIQAEDMRTLRKIFSK